MAIGSRRHILTTASSAAAAANHAFPRPFQGRNPVMKDQHHILQLGQFHLDCLRWCSSCCCCCRCILSPCRRRSPRHHHARRQLARMIITPQFITFQRLRRQCKEVPRRVHMRGRGQIDLPQQGITPFTKEFMERRAQVFPILGGLGTGPSDNSTGPS